MAAARLDQTGVIVGCAACGRQNRLAFPALGRAVRCGQCKAPVAPPAVPLEAPDPQAFDAAAAASALPLIVDFWAAWCGPCRMVAPEIERVAREAAGRYLVLKVDTDRLTDVAARFRIQSIPTLAVVYGGREIDRVSGARTAADILAFAERAVADSGRRAS
jgi:thioredoxin 2